MQGRFTIIDDAFVILRSRGVYKQAKAYERDGKIYAGFGAGFIQISKTGSTSVPNVRVDGFELGFEPSFASLGYLVKPDHPEAVKTPAIGWNNGKQAA
jgi:hypothetical protein